MSDALNILRESDYDSLIRDGYVEDLEESGHDSWVGRHVVLKKHAERRTRFWRSIGSFLFCPCACAGECFIGDGIWNSFRQYFCIPMTRGVLQEEGYVPDVAETYRLCNEDFQVLVNKNFDLTGVTALADQKREDWVVSSSCPSHCYVGVDGPESNFSYIVVIPDKDSTKAIAYAACNAKGEPCRQQERTQLAELLCRGYKPEVKQIRVAAKGFEPEEWVASLIDHGVGLAQLPSYPNKRTIKSIQGPVGVNPPEELRMWV